MGVEGVRIVYFFVFKNFAIHIHYPFGNNQGFAFWDYGTTFLFFASCLFNQSSFS